MSRPAVCVVGNVNADVLVGPATALPPPGEEWIVDSIEMRVGGAAANAALALARLGVDVSLVGCVGRDPLGSLLLDDLASAGVSIDHVRVLPEAATSVSIAFEASGRERSFLIALGSLGRFERSMMSADAVEAEALLLCGYFLLPGLRGDPAAELLGSARSAGQATFLDTGWDPGGWREPARDEVRGLLPLVDVFLPNSAEAAALSGESDSRSAAESLHAGSGSAIVIKLGERGCIAVDRDGELHAVDAPTVSITDTTGAGDAFNAGFVAATLRGNPPADALRIAVRVASSVVSRPSRDRYPSFEELVG